MKKNTDDPKDHLFNHFDDSKGGIHQQQETGEGHEFVKPKEPKLDYFKRDK
jgi:hypothetical protein